MQLNALMPDIYALIPYDYSAIKNPDYDKVISFYLTKATSQNHPKFVQVGGIPGSGKSTFCHNHHWNEQLFISFDAIMENIPEYRSDIYKLGHIESFKKWELPARIIGYEILRLAIMKKANIFLEHSGVCTPHVQLIKSLKKCGYETQMHYILCNLDVACTRALAREKITSRHTPPTLIAERYNLVKTYLETYSKMVDSLCVYDTTENKFVLCHNYQQGIQIC